MWMRIARHYRIDYVDQVLTKYRQHATQSTRDMAADPPAQPPAALKAIERILELYPEIRQELERLTYADESHHFILIERIAGIRPETWTAHASVLRQALQLWPTNPRYLMLYGASFLGPAQGRAARRVWRRITQSHRAGR